MNQSISFVVMAYNEQENLERYLPELAQKLQALGWTDTEILVVDDGSTDRTSHWMKAEQQAGQGWLYFRHPTNLGIGHVLRTGYENASKKFVVAIPGDGQFDLTSLDHIGQLQTKEIVSFYRQRLAFYTGFRKFLSKFNQSLNRVLFRLPLKDINWVKIYPTERLQALTLKNQSSLVETEICAKLVRRGCTLREIPTTYLPRLAGESKGASTKVVSQAALGLVGLIGELLVGDPLRARLGSPWGRVPQ